MVADVSRNVLWPLKTRLRSAACRQHLHRTVRLRAGIFQMPSNPCTHPDRIFWHWPTMPLWARWFRFCSHVLAAWFMRTHATCFLWRRRRWSNRLGRRRRLCQPPQESASSGRNRLLRVSRIVQPLWDCCGPVGSPLGHFVEYAPHQINDGIGGRIAADICW